MIDSLLKQLTDDDEVSDHYFYLVSVGAEGVGKGFPPKSYDEYHAFIFDLVKHCKGKDKILAA